MDAKLGSYIGFDESKYIEFKEFMIKIDPISYLDISDIKNIVSTGNLHENFNELILNNLHHYFKYYIPKYISAFGNLNENNKNGILYIGVNDFGEITGIPFIGELEKSFIDDIKDTLKIFVSTNNIDDLFEKISFELINVEKNVEYLYDDLDEVINNYNQKMKEYKDKYYKFLREHMRWVNMMERFTVKTSIFITDINYRKNLSEYIRNKTTNEEYLKIANQLDGNYEFKILNGLEISEQKYDMNNVYHWLTTYKDDKVKELKDNKPTRPPSITQNLDTFYEHQFQLLSNLRKRFVEKNSEIKYYILKINIPTYHDDNISYSNLGSSPRWMTKVRDIKFGNPCCI